MPVELVSSAPTKLICGLVMSVEAGEVRCLGVGAYPGGVGLCHHSAILV
jgi:hypothetical protein